MLPVAVNIKARGADVSVVGEQPKDKCASIRSDCYEALVKTAKQLSKYSYFFSSLLSENNNRPPDSFSFY